VRARVVIPRARAAESVDPIHAAANVRPTAWRDRCRMGKQ